MTGMSDNQFNLLIGVIGVGLAGIGAAIRFSVGRIVRALDANSSAMLDNTKSNAILSTKIDAIAGYVQNRSRVPSNVKDFIREEVSATHDLDPRIAAMDEIISERGRASPTSEDTTPVDPHPHPRRPPPTPGRGTPIGQYGPTTPKRKGTQGGHGGGNHDR